MPPEYQNPNPTPTTNSDYFSKYVVDPVKAILDTNLHKSLPILLIVGYVFIAFNTGFDKFIKVLYFMVFICFACATSFLLYVIQTNLYFISFKTWTLCTSLYSFCKRICKRIRLLEIFLVFVDILVLINFYCILRFSQGLPLRDIEHIVINL